MQTFIAEFMKVGRKQRGELWRFIKPSKHGSRHRKAQMSFFSKAKPVRRGRLLSWK